jgi:hypothetical protein
LDRPSSRKLAPSSQPSHWRLFAVSQAGIKEESDGKTLADASLLVRQSAGRRSRAHGHPEPHVLGVVNIATQKSQFALKGFIPDILA